MIPTHKLSTLIPFVLGLSCASVSHAFELSPNPNVGTISINTMDVESHAEPYTNSGQINISSGGRLTNFKEFTNTFGGVTISSGGTLANDATDGVFVIDENAFVSNNGLINNAGRFKNSSTYNSNANSIFNNLVGAELTNTRFMDQRGTLNNSGSFLNITSLNFFLQNTGTWNNASGSDWTNVGRTENFGTFNNQGSFVNRRQPGFSEAVINNHQGSTINNLSGGDMENRYRWFNRSNSTFTNAGTFTNASISLGISNELNATIDNLAGGVFINESSLNNQGTINNAGIFDVRANASNLTKGGSYTQTAGTTIINGTMRTLTMDIQGGVLMGAGTIDADVTIGANASFQPGNSPGTINIIGDLDLAGLLEIEITDNALFDVIDVTGTTTLSGDLDVSFFDIWRPSAGDTFDILFSDTIIGTFANLNLATLDNGLFWNVQYILDAAGTDRVQLAVLSNVSNVPLPASAWLFISGLIGLFIKQRRLIH